MMVNDKHDRVELNCLLICIISTGPCGGRGANIRESLVNQGGGGRMSFRDGSAAVDGSSNKAHIVDRSALSLLKTELIPGFHGMFNSSVMRASLLRTLRELVRQACDFLTTSGWIVTITSLSTVIPVTYYMDIQKVCSFLRNFVTRNSDIIMCNK